MATPTKLHVHDIVFRKSGGVLYRYKVLTTVTYTAIVENTLTGTRHSRTSHYVNGGKWGDEFPHSKVYARSDDLEVKYERQCLLDKAKGVMSKMYGKTYLMTNEELKFLINLYERLEGSRRGGKKKGK